MDEIYIAIQHEIQELLENAIADSEQRMFLRSLRDQSDPFSVPEVQFKKKFRMPQQVAIKLIELLAPFDVVSSSIPFYLKVLAALNFYGTGSYQTPIGVHYNINMAQPTVSRCISYVSDLISQHLAPRYIKFPVSHDEKVRKAAAFQNKFEISNTIGCIDCVHVAIIAPPSGDNARPARLYRNRKRFYSINVEAVCDADMLFVAVNAKFPGSVHDSAIWSLSPVKRHLIESNTNFWILADSGYPLEPWLLTPYPSPNRDYEKEFNIKHIRTRNAVERGFGILKSVFRCLLKHRTLHYHPTKANKIIYSCFSLYNFLSLEGVLENRISLNQYVQEDILINIELQRRYINEAGNIFTRGTQIRDAYARSLTEI